jgi:hypothetical protein
MHTQTPALPIHQSIHPSIQVPTQFPPAYRQILAHRQITLHGDAHLAQVAGRPNAGEHQQPR